MSSSNARRPDREAVLTRRRFVKGAAAAAAVPLIMPRSASALTARADDPDVLKVGLIGCGGRGTGAAYQALNAEAGTVRLVAMADVFEDRLESSLNTLRRTLGEERAHLADVAPDRRHIGFGAAERLIASDVDVVLLATPPHFRPAHLRAAIQAGKHVFTEKPMAVDGPGIRSVLETAELAKQANLSLVCGFCWRYNVRHRALFERVLDGAVGEIQAYYSTYNATPLGTHPRQSGWSDTEWQLRNWQHFTWLSGDHLTEQAVHSLDKMGWAFGDEPPISCTAVGGRQAREGAETGNVYDHFSVTYEYAGGAKGLHMSRQMANCSTDNSDYIWGTKGTATVQGWYDKHVITGPNAWSYDGPGNDMYQQEHNELFASIRSGKPINDGVWMARSTMLAVMGRMAAYTGQTITWDAALNSTESLGPERYAFTRMDVAPVAIPGRTKFV
jgi:predicted dehydrogenase